MDVEVNKCLNKKYLV